MNSSLSNPLANGILLEREPHRNRTCHLGPHGDPDALQELVETLAIDVIDNRGYYNLPDPRWSRAINNRDAITNADVVLFVDDNLPYGFLLFKPPTLC